MRRRWVLSSFAKTNFNRLPGAAALPDLRARLHADAPGGPERPPVLAIEKHSIDVSDANGAQDTAERWLAGVEPFRPETQGGALQPERAVGPSYQQARWFGAPKALAKLGVDRRKELERAHDRAGDARLGEGGELADDMHGEVGVDQLARALGGWNVTTSDPARQAVPGPNRTRIVVDLHFRLTAPRWVCDLWLQADPGERGQIEAALLESARAALGHLAHPTESDRSTAGQEPPGLAGVCSLRITTPDGDRAHVDLSVDGWLLAIDRGGERLVSPGSAPFGVRGKTRAAEAAGKARLKELVAGVQASIEGRAEEAAAAERATQAASLGDDRNARAPSDSGIALPETLPGIDAALLSGPPISVPKRDEDGRTTTAPQPEPASGPSAEAPTKSPEPLATARSEQQLELSGPLAREPSSLDGPSLPPEVSPTPAPVDLTAYDVSTPTTRTQSAALAEIDADVPDAAQSTREPGSPRASPDDDGTRARPGEVRSGSISEQVVDNGAESARATVRRAPEHSSHSPPQTRRDHNAERRPRPQSSTPDAIAAAVVASTATPSTGRQTPAGQDGVAPVDTPGAAGDRPPPLAGERDRSAMPPREPLVRPDPLERWTRVLGTRRASEIGKLAVDLGTVMPDWEAQRWLAWRRRAIELERPSRVRAAQALALESELEALQDAADASDMRAREALTTGDQQAAAEHHQTAQKIAADRRSMQLTDPRVAGQRYLDHWTRQYGRQVAQLVAVDRELTEQLYRKIERAVDQALDDPPQYVTDAIGPACDDPEWRGVTAALVCRHHVAAANRSAGDDVIAPVPGERRAIERRVERLRAQRQPPEHGRAATVDPAQPVGIGV